MLRIAEIKLPLDHRDEALQQALVQRLGAGSDVIRQLTVYKRSYDARNKKNIVFTYIVDVVVDDEPAVLARVAHDPHIKLSPDMRYRFVATPAQADAYFQKQGKRPLIIGMGPCGLFAALVLAQMGLKPVVLERGKMVRERTKDTWDLWRHHRLHTESNVQFGEGGAGTFSDGKLYSQIKDPHYLGRKVLEEFVRAGAPEEILYVNKPHIGTFRLVSVVESIRATIESLGGEIRFQQRVVDLDIEDGKISAVVLASGEKILSDHVVLALGHSARDTFEQLHRRGIYMEAKPFSIGFRIEHPQSLIDHCRLGKFAGNPLLGAADYKLVHHASNGRTVYSFCMCPGGTVVAAASEEGRVVTNGMSQYSRNERNANAAIVVDVTPADFRYRESAALENSGSDVLAGIAFQRHWESLAFELGGRNYSAPVQKVGDFLKGVPSTEVGSVIPSYQPAVRWGDLSTALPGYVIEAIKEALPAFDKKIRGFSMDDAVLTGVETRSSSPVRIKRDEETLQSLNVQGLFPAGEGAGYAGGILSAGVDGIRVAEAVAVEMLKRL